MFHSIQESLEKGYVLVAEDSLVQAKKLKRFFESKNIRCLACKNGAEAYEAATKEKPELIVSDIVMPVMDGYEFCKKVKADSNLVDIPFIILTSLNDPMDIIKGLQAGADNFITKPYDEDYLLSRINYLMANRHIRKMGSGDMSIEIMFQNQRFEINSDKKQILDLLLSVYEAAINRNEQLIEAQRQLEELNESLRNANQELEAFTHTVSHDLRTPVNGVLSFASLLNEMFEEEGNEEGKEYLDHIITSGNKMTQLIDDLLSYSRSASLKITTEEVDLSALAKEIIEDLTEVNYTADYEIKIEPGIMIKADKNLMGIAMENLLNNALKYSQKEENPVVEVGTEQKDNEQVVFVKDNGAGFDMEKIDSLFRPFIRLHAEKEFKGTGVGLSTVKRIIERHGGTIWAESAPGEGSVFYFSV
ncbi:MAG: response regulator [Bacteroidota bacterium]